MAAPMEVCLLLKEVLKSKLSPKTHATKRLVVCKNSKELTVADFFVPKGCLALVSEELSALLEGIRDTVIKESLSWSARISDVRLGKYNSLDMFVDRHNLFATCIKKVCKEGDNYSMFLAKEPQTIYIDLVCGSELGAHEDITMDDLRTLLLAQHIQLLLELQGHHVSVIITPHHFERCKTILLTLQLTSLNISHSTLADEDIQSFTKKTVCHRFCSVLSEKDKSVSKGSNFAPEETLEDLSETAASSGTQNDTDTKSEMSACEATCAKELSYEFNIKQFLEEKHYQRGRNCFDKNLTIAEVIQQGKPSTLLKHVIALDKIIQTSESSLCLHVVQQNQAFQLQKVHTVLESLSQNPVKFQQFHFIYGPVTHRNNDTLTDNVTFEGYFKFRHKQMHEAAVMKYGPAVQGEGWDTTINSITSAGIKFEFLSSLARNNLKLDVSNADDSNISDSRCGSFVMYNCARLATLFSHFQQSVDEGLYPPLPEISEVDFSTLREEAEWFLMFNFVYMYPEIVQQALEEFKPKESILSRLNTHKVCIFLSNLSRCLSSYYSHIHVLGENRPHLLKTMYARLYLLKSIHQIMVNGLKLLGITALSQL